ncbi:hypothetical protein [Actinoplanes siamensis]|uniref:Uncharacterized protein n=1 Tax=Actinoplanes siamensis TaxID=1223317 RepID=A0A919ND92_9ACTN|nr:hypothetical protein [Actinoplanes siamensis]GIF09102.1 hypothetical protein Asi03nite_66400 [Actinoplanes siamensis]
MAGASDNGGWPPDGGSSDELPDLPEEWGVIVIPDDLSELADEVEAVRAELHLAPPPNRWQRFLRRPGMRRLRRAGALLLRAPVLIVSMAILVTVASLFASAWPGPVRQPAAQRTSGSTAAPVRTLPALELIGSEGQAVPITGHMPVVILLVDGCDCAGLIAETAAAVDAETTVLAVSRSAPSPAAPRGPLATGPSSAAPGGPAADGTSSAAPGPPADATSPAAPGPPANARTPRADGGTVHYLRDPAGSLREHLSLTAQDGTAAAILVDQSGKILRTVSHYVAVKAILPDLERL